jgi:hypothetical protein
VIVDLEDATCGDKSAVAASFESSLGNFQHADFVLKLADFSKQYMCKVVMLLVNCQEKEFDQQHQKNLNFQS